MLYKEFLINNNNLTNMFLYKIFINVGVIVLNKQNAIKITTW